MFSILLFTKLRAEIVFLGAIGILFVTGVLDAKEAFSGFSSTSVVVIGVLFVVVAGMTHTGVLQWIVKHLLGEPKTYSKAIVRLMVPVAILSLFLSNTTVVALFVGIVKMWAKKLNVSASKLLIPLSYALGMGGICTLLRTAFVTYTSSLIGTAIGDSSFEKDNNMVLVAVARIVACDSQKSMSVLSMKKRRRQSTVCQVSTYSDLIFFP